MTPRFPEGRPDNDPGRSPRRSPPMAATIVIPRRRWLWASASLWLVAALLAWSGWRVPRPWLASRPAMVSVSIAADPTPRTTSEVRAAWPGGRLEGEPAKRLLLAALVAAGDR